MSHQLRVFNVMEATARLAVCAPTPEGYAFEHLSKPQKILHSFALLFDFVDAIDMILDTIQGFRLLSSGERPMFGVFLLGGIIIARVVASKGKRVLLNGGLQWAPFFQDRRRFYQRVGPHTALPALFAVLFTEISVFMFEDATMLAIWIATDSFDKNDIFDRLNAWFTLLSVAICICLLLGSTLAWVRLWKWESDFCSIVCQILSAAAFLAIFGIIVLFLIWLVLLGFQTIGGNGAETENPFLILVCFSWAFGSFFACTLRQRSRVPMIQSASWCEDEDSEGSNSNEMFSSRQLGQEDQRDNTVLDLESCSSGRQPMSTSNIENSTSSSDPSSDPALLSQQTCEELMQQPPVVATIHLQRDTDITDGNDADIPFVKAILLDDPPSQQDI